MPDDIDIRLFHYLHIGAGVFLPRMIQPITWRMDACHYNVQVTAGLFGKVHRPVRIHDIDFRSHQEPHAIRFPGDYIQVLKVEQSACTRHFRGMFCEGKRFEPPLLSCRRHFPDRTVCMPARQSMRVCICDDLHFHFHSPLHYIYYLYPPAKTGSNKTSSGKTGSSMPRSCAIKQYITFLREYNFLSRGY